MADVLNEVYEPLFYDFSMGSDKIKTTTRQSSISLIYRNKVNYIGMRISKGSLIM